MPRLTVRVRENITRHPLAFRAYLTDAAGTLRAPESPHVLFERSEERHFLAEGGFEADLPGGTYDLRIERGPEYVPYTERIAVGSFDILRDVTLSRWVWMNSCHWYSGDLHVHRRPEDMRLAVLAEDLNLGTNIVIHNAVPTVLPEQDRVELNDVAVYSTLDAEIERLFDGMGATLLLGLREPIDIREPDTLYPPDSHYTTLARAMGGHIDGEKPFWKGVPIAAALGHLDSMGVVPNHFHRQKVMRESRRWRAVPQDDQFVGDEGFALWILSLYYRLLNCGIRLPASGGSASGIMPSPVGYCRTYVRLDEDFSYDGWFTALRNGRSFATNGPMLFLTLGDADPGGLLRYALGEPVTLEARAVAVSQTELAYVELVRDGEVVARNEGGTGESQLEARVQLDFARSGWVAARCFERHEGNVRYAQTSPVYVFMGTDPIAVERDALFFEQAIARLIAQAESWTGFRESRHRDETLGELRAARDFYDMVQEAARARSQ
ncbi:hypothetical protein FJZ36_06045 [Candidatus Poribacteria bacterium]|nr:hypothetical protein [Candidatus Poribacteria bacterium]